MLYLDDVATLNTVDATIRTNIMVADFVMVMVVLVGVGVGVVLAVLVLVLFVTPCGLFVCPSLLMEVISTADFFPPNRGGDFYC